jgi:hypothetical protein
MMTNIMVKNDTLNRFNIYEHTENNNNINYFSLNRPESKKKKVNLDKINLSNNKNNSVKQLIYKKINCNKNSFNDQLKLDEPNNNNKKCNFVNNLIKTNRNVVIHDNQHDSIRNSYKFNENINLESKMENLRELEETSASDLNIVAYENLTYLSTDEEEDDNENKITANSNMNRSKLGQDVSGQLNADILKKTLKSIKRKDRLKKTPQTTTTSTTTNAEISTENKNSNLTKSMPDLATTATTKIDEINVNLILEQKKQQQDMISNSEYEKQLRKQFRNKVLSRSLRRAKCVYYRNIRSKSLEDLTGEERQNFLFNLNKIKTSSKTSLNSCSSATSNAVSISSSHFRELSDWSPEFSSCELDSSDDELLNNFDWDANLTGLSQIELVNYIKLKYYIFN